METIIVQLKEKLIHRLIDQGMGSEHDSGFYQEFGQHVHISSSHEPSAGKRSNATNGVGRF